MVSSAGGTSIFQPTHGHDEEITHAAVTALVAKIEGNPFSDWTSLMTQVVRAAMECQGMSRVNA